MSTRGPEVALGPSQCVWEHTDGTGSSLDLYSGHVSTQISARLPSGPPSSTQSGQISSRSSLLSGPTVTSSRSTVSTKRITASSVPRQQNQRVSLAPQKSTSARRRAEIDSNKQSGEPSASIRDLCPQDRSRIAALVEELAVLGEKNDSTSAQLEKERDQVETLRIERERLAREKAELEERLQQSQHQLLGLQTQLMSTIQERSQEHQSPHNLPPSVPNNHTNQSQPNLPPSIPYNHNHPPVSTVPIATATSTPRQVPSQGSGSSRTGLDPSLFKFPPPPAHHFNPFLPDTSTIQGGQQSSSTGLSLPLEYAESLRRLDQLREAQHRFTDPSSWPSLHDALSSDRVMNPGPSQHTMMYLADGPSIVPTNGSRPRYPRTDSGLPEMDQRVSAANHIYIASRRELLEREGALLAAERATLQQVLAQQSQLAQINRDIDSVSRNEPQISTHQQESSHSKRQKKDQFQRSSKEVVGKDQLQEENASNSRRPTRSSYCVSPKRLNALGTTPSLAPCPPSPPLSDVSTPTSLCQSTALPDFTDSSHTPSPPSTPTLNNTQQYHGPKKYQPHTNPSTKTTHKKRPAVVPMTSSRESNRPPRSVRGSQFSSPSSSILDILESMGDKPEVEPEYFNSRGFNDVIHSPHDDVISDDDEDVESQIMDELFFTN